MQMQRIVTISHPAPLAFCCAAATVMHGKAQMKAWLQERLGLAVDPSAPLIGFVGRLTMQKGVDVLLGAAPALLAGSNPPLGPSRWRPAVPEVDAAAGSAAAQQQPGPEGQVGSSAGCSGAEAAPPSPGASGRAGGAPHAASPPRQHAATHVSNAAQSSKLAVPAEQPAPAASEPGVQLVLLGTGEVRALLLLVLLLLLLVLTLQKLQHAQLVFVCSRPDNAQPRLSCLAKWARCIASA